jgi:hypothetical protein
VWLQKGLRFSWDDASAFVHSRSFASVRSYDDHSLVLPRIRDESELREQNGQTIVFSRHVAARATSAHAAGEKEGSSASDVPFRALPKDCPRSYRSQPQREHESSVRMVPKRTASAEASLPAEMHRSGALKARAHHKAILSVFLILFRIASQTSSVCVVLCLRDGCPYVQSTSATPLHGTETGDPRHETPCHEVV